MEYAIKLFFRFISLGVAVDAVGVVDQLNEVPIFRRLLNLGMNWNLV